MKENIYFLHFSGKGKPWNLEFIQYKNSNFIKMSSEKLVPKNMLSQTKNFQASFLL